MVARRLPLTFALLLAACQEQAPSDLLGGSALDASTPAPDAGVWLDAGAPWDSATDAGALEPFSPAVDSARLARARCQWSWRCQPELFPFEYTDVDDCTATHAEHIYNLRPDYGFRAGYKQVAEAIDAQAVTFDRAAFERCVAETPINDCGEVRPSSCDEVFEGSRGVQDACAIDEECGGTGQYCDTQQGECGTCRDKHAVTDPCPRTGTCAGRYSFCFAGHCASATLPDGEACEPFPRPDSNEYCTIGSYCPQMGSSHVCTPKRRVGESCGRGEECVSGAWCVSAVCLPFEPRGPQESCGRGEERCVAELACDDLSTCRPKFQAGERCQHGDCADGLYCDDRGGSDGVCRERVGAGQPCETGLAIDSRSCVVGSYCRPSDGPPTCEPFVWQVCR